MKLPLSRSLRPEDAEGLAVSGDGDGYSAHHAMVGQERRAAEPCLRGKVVESHRIAGGQGEAGLGLRVGRNEDLPDAPFLPADPRPQQQEFAARLQFQHVAELHLQRLSDQHDGLVQQRRDIVAYHRELAKGGHDGLLEGTVKEDFFGPLSFIDAFFE